jgi:cytochrome c-type biogenesis protein CcmH
MPLALLLALMTAAVLATVIAPLVKKRQAPSDEARFNRAVYRDQLRELERDLARGLIGTGEAAAARIEIERRLLATDAARKRSGPETSGAAPWAAAAIAVLLAAGSAGLYLYLGAPAVPDMPFAARQSEREMATTGEHADLEKTAAALSTRLAQNPNDGEGWLLLARTESVLGAWDKSAEAYRRALALAGNRADIAAGYGEALTMAADGIVTPEASKQFNAVLVQDPQNPVARYYLALAKQQVGDVRGAIADWQKLVQEIPEGSPLRTALARRISDAAAAAGITVPPLAAPAKAPPGPDAATMSAAAQLPPDQRSAMIRGMVAKLADQLRAKPDDLDGWLRLARSYGVLNEPDKAADALDHAAALKPNDPSIPFNQAEMLLTNHRPSDPIPDRALAALKRVQSLDPDEPAVLWYLGLAAVQSHNFDEAAQNWQKLLGKLPPDGSEHQMVAEALKTLKTKSP